MAQDPSARVASWLTVPAQAGGAGEKVATIEELAAVEFEPVDLSAKWAGYDWVEEWRGTGAFIRLAIGFLGKSKPELVAAVESILDKDDGQKLHEDFVEYLQTTQQRLQDYIEMLHAVEIRCLVASAALCLRKESAA
jgi:hypothetical protein